MDEIDAALGIFPESFSIISFFIIPIEKKKKIHLFQIVLSISFSLSTGLHWLTLVHMLCRLQKCFYRGALCEGPDKRRTVYNHKVGWMTYGVIASY